MPEKTLGHYALDQQLGAGGMGVVHRATDTRLGRQVAIKLLHDSRFNDPESRARFEREARVVASLNHPNIAGLHGLEEADGVQFLVLEYVPGETLAERLNAGAPPLREAIEICRQIADALAAAHEAGVVHRDLKPANIKITPEGAVKVLDFGLAKSLPYARSAGVADTATIALEMTQPGVVMGTAAYMSPEQASGKPVDRRTDIWAFGCVMYEALTGRRTFAGDSTAEVMVGILDREPDWSALPDNTPNAVVRLLKRCLAKDPRCRLHDIADARLELEDAVAGPTSAAPAQDGGTGRFRIAAGVAAAIIIMAAGVATWAWRRSAPTAPPRVVRFSFDLPPGSRIAPAWAGYLAFSPDSKAVVYPVNLPVVAHIRRIDELDSKPIPNMLGAGTPVFSPDGAWLLTVDSSKQQMVKMSVSGGAPVPVAPFDMPFQGEWGKDGYYYWTNALLGAVVRTPVNGGATEPVTELDADRQERTHRFVRLAANGKAVMFTVASGDIDTYNDARIDILDLTTRKRKPLIQGGACARYVRSGHVVYARDGSLYAVPINGRTLEAAGPSVKVLDGVLMSTIMGKAYYDISPAGDLAYAAGPVENGGRTLHWVDRQGKDTAVPAPARPFLNPRLSPDGKVLAVEVEGANHDLYFYDFARGVMSKATNDGASHGPIWSPDGKRIAFRTWIGGKMTLAWMPSDRSAPSELMVKEPAWQSAVSFSPDGKYLSYDQIVPTKEHGIWMLPLSGDRRPVSFTKSKSPTGAGKFSPDGRWIVYCSMESGKPEIYVQQWPGPGPKIQVSSDGGLDPLWRRDGKEIFYRNGSKMMSVSVRTQPSFEAGKPQALFEGEYTLGLSSSCGVKGATYTSYDVSPDGQRFLMIKDNDKGMYSTRIVVVMNWVEELKRIMADASGKKI